jgi:glycosyltransferase involved in cell wall biosynthesis
MVPTQGLMAELSKIGFDRLMVVPRGVDTENFSPVKRDDSLRQSWGATADTQVLLSVGRLAVEKNLDTVVRCFKSLQAKGLAVKLVIVGDGPMRHALERSVPEAIFAGTRTGQDLAQHYASADLFIFPSLTETFGNVTIEAMASGLAVVAYNHAAAGQLIEHKRNGMVLAPNQEEQLFEAARQLVDDAALRTQMRIAARQTAVDRDWSSVITRTEGIFRSLIANEDPSVVLVSSKSKTTVSPGALS